MPGGVARFCVCLAIVLAGLALALSVPAAQAGALVDSVAPCPTTVAAQPFLRWGDVGTYTLIPNGAFERGTSGWSLSAAQVVQGNEPYYVNDTGDSRSLWIAAGGTVTTPSVCVGIDRPTIRFFVRRSGSPLSSLTVEVLFEDAAGNVEAVPIGALAATNAWDPSAPLAVVANLLPLLPESRNAVAFRFSAGAGAGFFIDDVYIDPYRK